MNRESKNPRREPGAKNLMKRTGLPVLGVLLALLVSSIVYNNSWRVESDFAQQLIANVSALLMFLSLGFGALLVYPAAFFRGAGPAERIAACFVTPLAWIAKEVVRMNRVYSLAESVYFSLNPLCLGVCFGTIAMIGLCHIWCRGAMKRRGVEVGGFPAAAVAALAAGLSVVIFLFAWGLGVHSFYLFQEGYGALFGYGAGTR